AHLGRGSGSGGGDRRAADGLTRGGRREGCGGGGEEEGSEAGDERLHGACPFHSVLCPSHTQRDAGFAAPFAKFTRRKQSGLGAPAVTWSPRSGDVRACCQCAR